MDRRNELKPVKNKNLKTILSLIALIGVITAWFVGNVCYKKENEERIRNVLPGYQFLEQFSEKLYLARTDQYTFHIAIGGATGYEGPVKCALITDTLGTIVDIKIIEQTETPSYYKKVSQAKFLYHYLEQSISYSLIKENEPDAVSGATYTSIAIQSAVYDASKTVAVEVLNIAVPDRKRDVFQIRFLDILILVFFVAVLISRKLKPTPKKWVRYSILILAVITLGFTYNSHLSISRFNTLILGYWPDITQHLSWYILVFGVILLTFISGKNPYCFWFCPFGAIQEGIGKIGKNKWHIPLTYKRILLWIPRVLAWFAIVIALILHNPGFTSYEPFGMFFTLTGSGLLFAITIVVLILSLFINRPWCEFACPVPPVIDYIADIRSMIGRWF